MINMTRIGQLLEDLSFLLEVNNIRNEDVMDDEEKQHMADIASHISNFHIIDENLTARLGHLLIGAADQHIAPEAVDEISYDMLILANVDNLVAADLSDCMFKLAQFVEPDPE